MDNKDKKRVYGEVIELNFDGIKDLYNSRAKEVKSDLHAVMLQNEDSDLPIRRNQFEKDIIFNNLILNDKSKILDLGCGPGRIADIIPEHISYYNGLDFSEEFIKLGQKKFFNKPNFNFAEYDISKFYQYDREKYNKYNTVFIIATMIYLNDDKVHEIFHNLADACENNYLSQIYIRESISLMDERLTLNNFYSENLEANYSSIYRTDAEYKNLFKLLEQHGFYLYKEEIFPEYLGNNKETRQKYYILKRD